TYESLLGRAGKEPTVWAECLFVDPVADIAVLGAPDNQVYYSQAEAYGALVGEIWPFSVSEASEGFAKLLSLDGNWFQCKIERWPADGPIWVSDQKGEIAGGMSGSPILGPDGSAVGVIVVGNSSRPAEQIFKSGPHPELTCNLPGWLLRRLVANPEREE